MRGEFCTGESPDALRPLVDESYGDMRLDERAVAARDRGDEVARGRARLTARKLGGLLAVAGILGSAEQALQLARVLACVEGGVARIPRTLAVELREDPRGELRADRPRFDPTSKMVRTADPTEPLLTSLRHRRATRI